MAVSLQAEKKLNIKPEEFFFNKRFMFISHYQFGKIVIDNTTYTNDVIVYEEEVISNWWRKEGHRLDVDDLKRAPLKEGTHLIVGTGSFGRMTVTASLVEYCRKHSINLESMRTSQAVGRFNDCSEIEKILVGAFHLTC